MKTHACIFAFLLAAPAAAQDASPAEIFAAPIGIERPAPVTRVPLDYRMGKLFVEAAANGETREFIFDTGSPSIIDRDFADALGLETVGRNTGVDANGNPVTMEIAVLDTLRLGDTIFRRVPVLVFDFSSLPTGRCLIDGGVLGSEILPGSAWRIDAGRGELGVAESADRLGESEPDLRAALHDFGYPHAPVVDYAIGDIDDRALFDTGSAEEVTLFARVAESDAVRARIVPGSLLQGAGYEGESAGGRGETGPLARFTLEDFRIGGQEFGRVRSSVRGVPPSLVGAGLLDTYTVTLDYPGEGFLLERRGAPAPDRPEMGYSVAFTGEHAEIVQLFANSPAAAAGLRLGDRVVAIDGRSLEVSGAADRCAAVRWLVEDFEPALGAEIQVEREDGPASIRVPAG